MTIVSYRVEMNSIDFLITMYSFVKIYNLNELLFQ